MVEGCNKIFVTPGDLQKHSKTHLGQKDFVCEMENCKKEFTTAHHLKVFTIFFFIITQRVGEFLESFVTCVKLTTVTFYKLVYKIIRITKARLLNVL